MSKNFRRITSPSVSERVKFKKRGDRKFKGMIFGSVALMLNVYSNDKCSDKSSAFDSVNKVFGYLTNIFDRNKTAVQVPNLASNESHQKTSLTLENTSHVSRKLKLYYVNFISKVRHQNMSRTMMYRQTDILDLRLLKSCNRCCGEGRQESLVGVAQLLVELNRLVRRQSRSRDPPLKNPASSKTASTTTSTTTCDKSIQCCKSTEFLKVSSDTKFFSRSSVVVNFDQPKLDRRNSSGSMPSPSLEYVASYRPEDGVRSNLRSFSSSAIFGRRNDDAERRTPTRFRSRRAIDVLSSKYNFPSSSQKLRSRRRVRASTDRLRETIRRTENEILRYSKFITEDLASFHRDTNESIHLDDNDVASVKQILLDDYITEVKQIIRSESIKQRDCNNEMLESVKQRMDEDVVEGSVVSAGAESWQSSPCKSSYVTARESLKSSRSNEEDCDERCCYYCDKSLRLCCDCCYSGASGRKLQGDGYCCKFERGCRKRIGCDLKLTRKCSSCRDEACSYDSTPQQQDSEAVTALAAKSSQSVDSGVAIDFSRNSSNHWRSSASSTSSSSAERNSNDEVLCQTVENAVKKFTDELIKCERRARSRVTSDWKQQQRQTSASRSVNGDQSGFNYPTNSRRYSNSDEGEEEIDEDYVAGISTPSLVSLSD